MFHEDDGAALALEVRDGAVQLAGSDEAGLAQPDRLAVDGAGDAVAGDGLDVGGLGHVRRSGEDGGGERVLAACLQSGGDRKHFFAVGAVGGNDVDDLGTVARERAGLVQGDDGDTGERFERGAALDEDARPGGCADGSDDRDGDGDGKRTGGGSHEHDEGAFDPKLRVAEERSEHGDGGCGHHDPGYKWSGDALGEALTGALALLGLLHDVDDAGEAAVAGPGGDLDVEDAATVDRSREHLGARLDLDRQRLTGDG